MNFTKPSVKNHRKKKKKFKVVTNFIKYSLQIDIKIKIDGF